MGTRSVRQVLRHCIGHCTRLRVVHLDGQRPLRGGHVLPDRRVCSVSIEKDLDVVAGIEMFLGEKLDGSREERITHRRRAIPVSLRYYLLDRRPPGYREYSNQQQHNHKGGDTDAYYVLDDAHSSS